MLKILLKNLYILCLDSWRFCSFHKSYAAFRDVFENLESAAKSTPKTPKNTPAQSPKKHNFYICEYEYPLFFYLQNILKTAPSIGVFDLGGAFGAHALRFCHATKYAPKWLVCELEEKIEAFRALSRESGAPNLAFTSDISHARDYEVFLSSGALQYILDSNLAADCWGGGQC